MSIRPDFAKDVSLLAKEAKVSRSQIITKAKLYDPNIVQIDTEGKEVILNKKFQIFCAVAAISDNVMNLDEEKYDKLLALIEESKLYV